MFNDAAFNIPEPRHVLLEYKRIEDAKTCKSINETKRIWTELGEILEREWYHSLHDGHKEIKFNINNLLYETDSKLNAHFLNALDMIIDSYKEKGFEVLCNDEIAYKESGMWFTGVSPEPEQFVLGKHKSGLIRIQSS